MKVFDPQEAGRCAGELLSWFAGAMRPLPWRQHYRPYEIWISEVMLQQTQMERGVRYFQRWMERFPDVAAVAAAPEDDILQAWEGLGYYRRARYVQAAAKAMVERHGGRIPDKAEELSALPGLGPYTVAAILSIAYNQDVLTVDANVERVFARLLDLDEAPRRKNAARIIREQATLMMPSGKARLYNQALMEFGALVCGKAPRCMECPLRPFCESFRQQRVKERPVQDEKISVKEEQGAYGILSREGKVFVVRRPEGGLWAGLREFPGALCAEGEKAEAAVRRVYQRWGIEVRCGAVVAKVRHSYTNHKLKALFLYTECEAGAWRKLLDSGEGEALPVEELHKVAMPAHHRKAADSYFNKQGRAAGQLSLFQ